MRLGQVRWLVAILVIIGGIGRPSQESPARASPTGASSCTRTSPAGPRRSPRVRTGVRMRVTGPIARVAVTQEFLNPTAEWLEGVYVFPLPEGAAVDACGSRSAAGDRGTDPGARGSAQIVPAGPGRAGQKASLLEQERPNIFTMSVANVGPSETVHGGHRVPGGRPLRRRASSGSASRWWWGRVTSGPRRRRRGARAPAGASTRPRSPTPSGSRLRCAIRPRARANPVRLTGRARRGLAAPAARQPVPRDRDDADVGDWRSRSRSPTRRCRRTATSSSCGRRIPGSSRPPLSSPSGTTVETYALVMLVPPVGRRALSAAACRAR